MLNTTKLKETFEVESKHGAFFTGGNVEWYNETIFCQTQCRINLLNTENGCVSKTLIGEEVSEDADFIQTFTTDGTRIVTSHKSGLLKLWNLNGELEKMWKYIHKGPIARLRLNGNNLLASGGSDGAVRIWDLLHQACISSLKGCHGVVNVVEFDGKEMYASGDDGKILCWKLDNRNELLHQYQGHYSKVTSLELFDNRFVTCGRDKVIILWQKGRISPLKVIPVLEAVEAIVKLPLKFKVPGYKSDPDGIYVASAGENGLVRIWDVRNTKEIYKQDESLVSKASEEGGLAVTKLLCNNKTKTIAIVSVDHNIILYHLKSFICLKQFVGFSDEILDITFVGKNDSHLAVATNSCDIKLYDNATMSCQLLKGHTDIVLSVISAKTKPNLLASSSKDNQIRLWLLRKSNEIFCVAVGIRHTSSIASLVFPQNSASFLASGSHDTCLKLWEIPEKFPDDPLPVQLNCLHTELVHQKDINCIAISPNDKIIATASQDKTAKLWTDSLSLIGTLRGHKRGVWSIRFSPVDQVAVTSSADCTIKLWSVSDLNCLKTLEGHESSVLQVEFMSNGLQLLSAGADGLIKIFSIKTSECTSTISEHDGRIWALAMRKDELGMVTGGSDSLLIKWRDATEERQLERVKEQEQMALEEQKLSNYIHNDQLLKALKLALKLERPLQVLKIVQGVIKKGDTGLSDTIKELKVHQKESLLKCATNWNTNSRNCQAAQLVLNILLNELQSGEFRPVGLSGIVEGTLPYTERHFKRLTTLMQDLYFINYTINCMQPHAKST